MDVRFAYLKATYGGVAQLVEQVAVNHQVEGSSPSVPARSADWVSSSDQVVIPTKRKSGTNKYTQYLAESFLNYESRISNLFLTKYFYIKI